MVQHPMLDPIDGLVGEEQSGTGKERGGWLTRDTEIFQCVAILAYDLEDRLEDDGYELDVLMSVDAQVFAHMWETTQDLFYLRRQFQLDLFFEGDCIFAFGDAGDAEEALVEIAVSVYEQRHVAGIGAAMAFGEVDVYGHLEFVDVGIELVGTDGKIATVGHDAQAAEKPLAVGQAATIEDTE